MLLLTGRSLWCIRVICCTLLFDLSDLSHGLLQDGTFVRLNIEAVDVGEVGRDELSQLLDVLALLFPPTFVTPAGMSRGLKHCHDNLTSPYPVRMQAIQHRIFH